MQVSREEARNMTEFASFATVVSGTSLEHEFAAAYVVVTVGCVDVVENFVAVGAVFVVVMAAVVS
jgi:hypothetical protein